MASKARKIFFSTKVFSFVIVAVIFLIFTIVFRPKFFLFQSLQLKVLDTHFALRLNRSQLQIQRGVTLVEQDLNIHPDILILGIDNRTLDDFGSWPFPRYRHADFLNTITRVQDQTSRESVVFLDILFNERSASDPLSDALLFESMKENGRTILETRLSPDPNPAALNEEYTSRQDLLVERFGSVTKFYGDWNTLSLYKGSDPPLPSAIRSAGSYGSANISNDSDNTLRNLDLAIRGTKEIMTVDLNELESNYEILQEIFNSESMVRIGWDDKTGSQLYSKRIFAEDGTFLFDDKKIEDLSALVRRTAPPIPVDEDGDGEPDTDLYEVQIYEDYIMPSVALSIVAQYLNIDISDIEIHLGEYVLLPSPRIYNPETRALETYTIQTRLPVYDSENPEVIVEPAQFTSVPEIRIPINEYGQMRINFIGEQSSTDTGGPQTFPVRSYSAYARRATGPIRETWPSTMALDNKIILAGFFAGGLDEETTSVGQMYGIEAFANAINTILLESFLVDWEPLYQTVFLAALLVLIAFMTGRTNNFVALGITLILIFGIFVFADIMFNSHDILVASVHPSFAIIFAFLSIVIYRGLTEEREKRRVQGMFGQYVSPDVVKEIVNATAPPELGGVDKDLTVFFSDIRGFTTLSEKMSPQDLVNHLNVYLTAMTDIIMEYKGTLDKYVGDEIMCFWGAPTEQKNHAVLACQSALMQMKKLRELNNQWPSDMRIDIGIGINSGIMTVGNMGSAGRMNYTLMGDNVNLGARLEGINKQYFGQEWFENGIKHYGTGSKIIISEYTYGRVKDKVIARELDNIRVKGKNKPVVIYELIDMLVGEEPFLE